jgi:signal transduction histidine kinase
MKGWSVRTKVFLLFSGAALLAVLPALVLISRAVEARVYERATQELVSTTDALRSYWNIQGEALQENVRRLALEREVPALILARDTARLRRLLAQGVSDRRVVLVADSTGAALLGPPLDSATLQGGTDSSVITFPVGEERPIRVAVWPVWSDSGRIGIVGVGSRLDERAVREFKEVTGGAEVALVVGENIIASTLPDSLTRILEQTNLPAVVERGGIWRRQAERLRYLYAVHRLPTRAEPAAALLFRPVEHELRLATGIRESLVGIGFAALALALLLSLVVARIVARPAQVLAAAASDLARGSYSAPLPATSGDEIGQLTRAFGDMRAAIAEREARLRSAQAELIHREKLAAMGRLVAQLSHEINNPIYNIQNCLEVLERRGDPADPNRQFVELAREELDRMAVLTRQLLDQSRPLSDKAGSLDLNQMVQRVLMLAGSRLQDQGIQVKADLAPGLPPVVAHPDAIQQVLANLVDNAIDAMASGGELRVSTRPGADAVEVVVEDTGPGIAPEHLPHIFEAFYTTKPGVRGIGLGLFVSEGIVRGHRGRLTVESEPGAGSRFVVQLPREALDATVSDEERAEHDRADNEKMEERMEERMEEQRREQRLARSPGTGNGE